MKKTAILLPLTAVLMLAALSAYVALESSDIKAESTTLNFSSCEYFVRAENGYLAIYTNDEMTPVEVSDEMISPDLPQEELKKLSEGLSVKDAESLLRIIEAYTS